VIGWGVSILWESKIAISHWQSQSQSTLGWRYRAACDVVPEAAAPCLEVASRHLFGCLDLDSASAALCIGLASVSNPVPRPIGLVIFGSASAGSRSFRLGYKWGKVDPKQNYPSKTCHKITFSVGCIKGQATLLLVSCGCVKKPKTQNDNFTKPYQRPFSRVHRFWQVASSVDRRDQWHNQSCKTWSQSVSGSQVLVANCPFLLTWGIAPTAVIIGYFLFYADVSRKKSK